MPHTLVKSEASRGASTSTIQDGLSVKDSANNRFRGVPVLGMSREDVSGLMPEPRVAIERAGREMHEAEKAAKIAKIYRHGSVEMQHARLRHRAAKKEFKRLILLDRTIERLMAFEIGHHMQKDWEHRSQQWHLTGSAKLPEEQEIDDRLHLADWWCHVNSGHRNRRYGIIEDQKRYGKGSLGERLAGDRREHFDQVPVVNDGRAVEQVVNDGRAVEPAVDAGRAVEQAVNDGRVVERDFERDVRNLDKNGFDRSGFDKDGFDQYGFDKQEFNRVGSDRYGFDRQGRPHRGEHLAHCGLCKLRQHEMRQRYDRSTADSVTVGNWTNGATAAPSTAAASVVGTEHGSTTVLAPTDDHVNSTQATYAPSRSIPHEELHAGAREGVGDGRLDYACHHHHCHAASDGYLGMLIFNFIRRGELHMTRGERMKARKLARQEGRAVAPATRKI